MASAVCAYSRTTAGSPPISPNGNNTPNCIGQTPYGFPLPAVGRWYENSLPAGRTSISTLKSNPILGERSLLVNHLGVRLAPIPQAPGRGMAGEFREVPPCRGRLRLLMPLAALPILDGILRLDLDAKMANPALV